MQTFKIAGSTAIVLAAVCIMLPGLVSYLTSLWHLALLLVLVVILAWVIAVVIVRFKSLSGDATARQTADDNEVS